MPKPVYQIFLAAFMLTIVAAACNNKKGDKAKEATKDSVAPMPAPTVIDTANHGGDSLIKKPTDPGTVPHS